MANARIGLLLLGLLILLPPHLSRADQEKSIFEVIRADHESLEKGFEQRPVAKSFTTAAVESQAIDVEHYRLQIRLSPEDSSIFGTVAIVGSTTASVRNVNIDASSNLTIDSVQLDGVSATFSRTDNRLTVNFPVQAQAGRQFTIVIRYHGAPAASGGVGAGMMFNRHGPDFNSFVMATLSEPFGAPKWWPCIDDPADKATAEIEITVPQGNLAASNGVLDKVQPNADGTVTYFWREDSPLSTYLVSVAATNYERFEDTYTALDGTTKMPLVFYAYPEHLELARLKFAVTLPAIQIYARLFGEYPFLSEKYGMAEFQFSGAMEHQTITSISASSVGSVTNNNQATIVHELAHHWWGDLVTMRTWNDIWLNEGFATYSEVLFFERFSGMDPGELMSRSYDDGVVDGALRGTVTAENLDNPFDDQGAIYRKGGWVLHMLRHVLGDQKFFDALQTYAKRFGFSNASTRDFQQVCEEKYGDSLDWFFSQWIYAPARPVYKVSSEISGGPAGLTVKLTIKQKQTQEIPGRAQSVYIMPLDVTINYLDETSETHVVWNDARKQKFTFAASKPVENVTIDDRHWVLKKIK